MSAAHDPWDELAAGYALSALEPDEEARFLVHLSGCRRCAATLADTARVMADLAHLPPSEAPPDSLRAAVLAAAAAERATISERGVSPAAAADSAAAAAATSAVAAAAATDHFGSASAGPAAVPPALPAAVPPVGLPGPRRAPDRTRRQALVAAAVAGVLVLGGGIAGGLAVRDARQDAQRTADLAAAQLDRLTQERDAVLQVLARPGTREFRLAGAPEVGRLTALVSPERAFVVVDGMRPNDPTTTYVLWGESAAGLQPLGTFDVASTAVGLVEVGAVSVDPTRYSAMLVNKEPGRRAPAAPTSPVLLSGRVA